jgi:glutaredoxin
MPRLLLSLLLCALAGTAAAQGAYRWIDNEGRLHFTDTPPPKGAAKKVETMKRGATAADETLPFATRKAMEEFPVVVYVTGTCGDPCQQGRDLLKQRGVPFAETDVGSAEGQAAFKAATGQTAENVPILAVGSHRSTGFLAGEWNGLLDAAGYPKSAKAR